MKKKIVVYILLIIGIIFFNPTTVYAKEKNIVDNNYKYIVNSSINNNIISLKNSVQISDCTGQNTILGNVNDPNSVAWLLQKILNYVRVIGPFIVLIMSSLDYIKAILSSDDDSLKNSHKKLITRLVLIVALFLLPTLVSVLLNILGFTSHEVCGLQ